MTETNESRLEKQVRHYYTEENHNCAETLLAACNEAFGLNLPKESTILLSGFGRGMFTGNVCGALAGCNAALACMLVDTKAHDCAELPKAQQLLNRNFRNTLSDTQCSKLRGIHHSEETRCLKTCLLAAKAMNQTLAELQEKGVVDAGLIL